MRNLVVILGDQLDRQASAWDGFDPALDMAWMCEASDESTHVWSSRQRIAVFIAAMRHFAADLRQEGLPLLYAEMADTTLAAALSATLQQNRPQRVVLTEPGDWRVLQSLRSAVAAEGIALDIREDRHFICSTADFAVHAKGRRQLRMEPFYRAMRRRHRVLMESGHGNEDDGDGVPCGGAWNYDTDNRAAFGPQGPGFLPPPTRFEPDAITAGAVALVQTQFAGHPGRLDSFGWPVTRPQALQVLHEFVQDRLALFGHWQDAMWQGQPWLYHSQLSVGLNLKLLHPREVIAAAEAAWRAGRVPLAAVEGFIRQVLGWREYVRGVYWLRMPQYGNTNALQATRDLPAWYWTGDVPMQCLKDAISQTLEHGYAHHIQRLMVTGLYAMLHGVEPKQVHGWYLSVYVDAVEWVEMPNTLGMSQYADGGFMGSKPYAASGKYIKRMSDHCRGCRFDPALRTGPRACPFTTLYWDFLLTHQERFADHPRMALQVKNARRLDDKESAAIQLRAAAVRDGHWDAP